MIFESHDKADVFKPLNAMDTAKAVSAWTPVEGKKFHLLGGFLSSSVTGNLVFTDGQGSPVLVIPCVANQPFSFDLKAGITSEKADNGLMVSGPLNSTISGTLYGNEE